MGRKNFNATDNADRTELDCLGVEINEIPATPHRILAAIMAREDHPAGTDAQGTAGD